MHEGVNKKCLCLVHREPKLTLKLFIIRNSTSEQQSASFRQHNKPDQMSSAIMKTKAERK